jgi:uncharacterized coiled-coil DUF342 family protein
VCELTALENWDAGSLYRLNPAGLTIAQMADEIDRLREALRECVDSADDLRKKALTLHAEDVLFLRREHQSLAAAITKARALLGGSDD